MGWFWGSSPNLPKDAYSNLDPSLREFLDKESPSRNQSLPQNPSQPPPSETVPTTYRAQTGLIPPSTTALPTNPSTAQAPAVPPESLYQDGRYAHLWTNYRPLSAVEASSASDQDRLSTVYDAFNSRKAAISRAALENCVLEQIAESDCFKRGGVYARMTMCREENRKFSRCYSMQSRFLKALGYLSMERTREQEERIQMHSDKLYQEMLAQEQAVEEAKAKGVAVPEFKPLINGDSVAEALGVKAVAQKEKEQLEMFSPEQRKDMEKKLEGKSPTERNLEIQLLVAEAQASKEYAAQVSQFYDEERKLREERREKGKQTIGDGIKSLWGWDK